ncbi:DAK2 domain-containing protein [Clostridium sp. UBA1056]|uniref:DAK2 domain-containing protein n=1 Tax=unclassified Clostridium TaxID=2614128 RepID=UPI0032174989
MTYIKINGRDFSNMIKNASNALEKQKEYVNSLNVFPVPDGDTGTNMSLTFKAAAREIESLEDKGIGEVSKKLAKGALMGARGNSGVILSQILRGMAKGLENAEEATIEEIKNSFVEGSNFAYKAVMRPTEGTILTIIRAAGEAAICSEAENIVELLEEICEESKRTLDRTPEMLPQLKQAKVVDAGGMGLLIILRGMLEALKNKGEVSLINDLEGESENNYDIPELNMSPEDIKFGYCTEFIILDEVKDIPKFKDFLESHGDSLVLVGLEDITKVHVHTNDPGAVLSKAVTFGALSKIKIENMREQHRSLLGIDENSNDVVAEEIKAEPKAYGFVTVARGNGISAIFKDLGVDEVIEGGQTMNPSTEDIVNSINKINAEVVFVLPNNKNIIMAATQAVDLIEDKKVIVIPTKTIPQGITAITMFNPDGAAEENESSMNETIETVTSGSVTYAVKDTEDDGRAIKEGDILGLLEGKISEIGQDVYAVCKKLIENMVDEESELITIFYGEDCEEDKVDQLVTELEEAYPDMDVQCFNGEQPLYYFITSVE